MSAISSKSIMQALGLLGVLTFNTALRAEVVSVECIERNGPTPHILTITLDEASRQYQVSMEGYALIFPLGEMDNRCTIFSEIRKMTTSFAKSVCTSAGDDDITCADTWSNDDLELFIDVCCGTEPIRTPSKITLLKIAPSAPGYYRAEFVDTIPSTQTFATHIDYLESDCTIRHR